VSEQIKGFDDPKENARCERTSSKLNNQNANNSVNPRWGATENEWFLRRSLAPRDVTVSVANPDCSRSPTIPKHMIGKVPSVYSSAGQCEGLRVWPDIYPSEERLDKWQAEPDYNIGVICRRFVAVDCNIECLIEAREMMDFAQEIFGQVRFRCVNGSPRFAFLLELKDGELLTYRTFKTNHGVVRLLGRRQHLVVAGTHPSGNRYFWTGDGIIVPQFDSVKIVGLFDILRMVFGIGKISQPRHSKDKSACPSTTIGGAK
jgi:hypothetical protein